MPAIRIAEAKTGPKQAYSSICRPVSAICMHVDGAKNVYCKVQAVHLNRVAGPDLSGSGYFGRIHIRTQRYLEKVWIRIHIKKS